MKLLMTAIVMIMATSVSPALMQAYSVEPVKASWSGWIAPELGISQTITCNWDQLDSATGAYVEFFVGSRGASPGVGYELNVYEVGGGVDPIASSPERVAYRDHAWLKFPLTVEPGYKFTKGKQYEFKFTRSGSDSIQYYYSQDNPYPYGSIPGDHAPNNADLALRTYGVMDTIGADWFGVNPYFPWKGANQQGGQWWGPDTGWDGPQIWRDRATAAGVGAVRYETNWFWFSREGDTIRDNVYLSYRTLGIEPYGLLFTSDESSSTHFNDSLNWYEAAAPPRNLFEPVDSDSNLWARFVERTVRHHNKLSGYHNVDSIRVWEIWNEPNIIDEYWRRPNTRDYDTLTPMSDRAMCSLYVQLCWIAASVLKDTAHGGHQDNKVLVGSLGDLEHEDGKVKGKTWLRWMYEIANNPQYGGPFWDGVAFHYYDDPHLSTFEANAETLRAIMRDNGDYGELWITETGWTPASVGGPGQAHAVACVFTTGVSSPVRPGGGYDHVSWFAFRDTPESPPYHSGFKHGLMDTTMLELKHSFHAFTQTGAQLRGKRAVGRYLLGTPQDDSVRIYEFEDPDGKRMWIGWEDDVAGFTPVTVKLPTRSDEVAATLLDYNGNEQPSSPDPGANGWLTQTLTPRPVFITETGDISRPDLQVDSVRLVPAQPQVGMPLHVIYSVRNHGTGGIPQSWAAGFYWNDSLLNPAHSWPVWPDTALDQGQNVSYHWTIQSVPPSMQGHGLLRVTVNPDQVFVELGTDDNSAYRRLYINPDPSSPIEP